MNQSNPFLPKLTDPYLIFSAPGGSIEDLKRGIRRLISYRFPRSVSLLMTQALNYNFVRSKDRSSRVILVTSDDSPQAHSVLIDLWAWLQHNENTIRTARAVYTATLDGFVDAQKVAMLALHYFWLSNCFENASDRTNERHLLN